MKILFIEDEQKIGQFVKKWLEEASCCGAALTVHFTPQPDGTYRFGHSIFVTTAQPPQL